MKNFSSLNPLVLGSGQLSTQKGQTLLIVVLVMVIALTIGLSVASRSIISLRTVTEEENSQRAFSAAEAGIEKVLKEGSSLNAEVSLENLGINSIIKKAELKDIKGLIFLLKNGSTIQKDEGADIWLSTYPNYTAPLYNGNLTIRWEQNELDPCKSAAIEVIVVSGSTTTPKTSRYAFDPCSARPYPNQFSLANASTYTSSGITFSYASALIPVVNGLIARAIPLYESTSILIQASADLPIQGKQVYAVGESGGAVRQVSYYQGFPELPPEFFQYILFAPK